MAQRRARAIPGGRAAACYDPDPARTRLLAQAYNELRPCRGRDELFENCDIVIVSTPHSYLAENTLAAVRAGRHVLIEKPGACRPEELDPIAAAASRRCKVRVGYNHRFHPALCKARRLWLEGAVGEPRFVRGRYGHGGRIGYEKEWRFDRNLSGGGQVIDQGAHLIDLARWFLGEFASVAGRLESYFWQAPVEDNAFMLLATAENRVAQLHAGWTEWKNLFSFEIFGTGGKLEITGLGGSYGVERLTFYRMLPQMGPPETTSWEWPMGDNSFAEEFAALVDDIHLDRDPEPGLADARAVLEVIVKLQEIVAHDH